MKKNLLFILLLMAGTAGFGQCDNLFFSEYIEGSSSNKAIEIYNPTRVVVNLENYMVQTFSNGGSSASYTLNLQGKLYPGQTFVIANPSANAAILAQADTTHSVTFYNGDDAVALIDTSTWDTLDIIGVIGVDPGTNWTVGAGATSEYTLVRNVSINSGEENWTASVPGWNVFAQNMTDSLGAHSMTPCSSTGCSQLFFSEYLEGSSNNKAIEIYNPTDLLIDLRNYTIHRFNNGAVTPSGTFYFDTTLAPGATYVIANPSAIATILSIADTTHSITFFNGDDAMVLIDTTTVDTLDIIGVIGVDPGTNWTVGAGATSEYTLVRNVNVQEGETNWTVSVPAWDVFPQNMADSLGGHSMQPCGVPAGIQVSFALSAQNVSESSGAINVDVTITNPNASPTSVDVVLLTGSSSATNGSDFNYTPPTTVTFPGSSSANQTVTVTITDDALVEGTEDIVLELQNPTNGATIGLSQHTITISDNDFPFYNIGQIEGVDGNGQLDSLGVKAWFAGIVHSPNFRPSGLEFDLIDTTGGAWVFDFSQVSGYTPQEGDSIRILATVAFYNGLLQLNPDSIQLISGGNPLYAPAVVNTLDESTEGEYIQLNNMWIINPAQWTGSGSGFNVDVTNGTDTLTMRVDADVNLYGMTAPLGMFHLRGIGSQYDFNSPYTSGYQVLPRYDLDIIPVIDLGNDTTVCSDSLLLDGSWGGAYSYLWSGSQTTSMISAGTNGTYWVQVMYGASSGSDTINLTFAGVDASISSDTMLCHGDPYVFTDMSTGSPAPNSWFWDFGNGDTSTVQNPTQTYFLNNDTLDVMLIAGNGMCSDTAYQTVIVQICMGVDDELTTDEIRIYPNPAQEYLVIESAGETTFSITDAHGREVYRGQSNGTGRIDISRLEAGVYFVRMMKDGKAHWRKLIVE